MTAAFTDPTPAAAARGAAGVGTLRRAPGDRPACGNCGEPCPGRPQRGWCSACYFRWYRAGADPEADPPAPRRGRARTAAIREDCAWLIEGGLSVEEVATRVGVTPQTVRRHIAPPTPPPVCAHADCVASATFRRWCDEHRDLRRAYLAARAAELSRWSAACRIGVYWRTTYRWEPGEPGVGRPRKEATA